MGLRFLVIDGLIEHTDAVEAHNRCASAGAF